MYVKFNDNNALVIESLAYRYTGDGSELTNIYVKADTDVTVQLNNIKSILNAEGAIANTEVFVTVTENGQSVEKGFKFNFDKIVLIDLVHDTKHGFLIKIDLK